MATVEDKQALSSSDVPSLWENGITLQGVSWDTYCKFVDSLGNRKIFVTYDRGLMEIQTMSPSFPHENADRFLEALVQAIRLLKGIAFASGGSTTHRRADFGKGIEPDACYWIEHEPQMRGVKKLDLATMPPPDLVIEIDIHASSIDRIETYRKLGVPEIWHIQDGKLRFLVLEDTDYTESPTSRSFPFVDSISVGEALVSIEKLGETEALNRLLKKLQLR